MRSQATFILFAAFLACFSIAAADDCDKPATADFVPTVRCLNYPVETHEIITDDQYKLKIFRIQAKNTKITADKPVILMWHGLLDSADAWVVNEEELAPAYILANKGYDVWLGNSRGNKYSIEHVTLDATKHEQYWAFSWQQMSEHDLPAAFSYIAKFTSQKINYIGHSQGTTQMFASLANPSGKNQAVTNNLRKFAALGPVAYLSNVRSTLINTLSKMPLLPQLIAKIGKYGLLTPNFFQTEGGRLLCKIVPFTCSLGMSLISDDKPSANNKKILEKFAGHFPAGTSVQDFLHWRQSINAGGAFQKYDFGTSQNQIMYGQSKPPQYDPKLITEDVHLFVGADDLIANNVDAARWAKDMSNAKVKLRYYPMGHLTFQIGAELTYMEDLLAYLA